MKTTVTVLSLCLGFLVCALVDAGAQGGLPWVYSPESVRGYGASGGPTLAQWHDYGYGLAVGWCTHEEPDMEQPGGVFGAALALPVEYNQLGFGIAVTEYHFFTWDAYVPGDLWDVMSATITRGDTYWNLDLVDPLSGNPAIERILYSVGGTSRGTYQIICPDAHSNDLFLPPDLGEQYYLNFVLDTRGLPQSDVVYASAGFFRQVHVGTPGGEWGDYRGIPEPSTLLLLGPAAAAFVVWRVRRRGAR